MSADLERMTAPNGKVCVVVYTRAKAGWKPTSVTSIDDRYVSTFDFDWCEASQQLCYHESSGGAGGKYELHPFIDAPKVRGKIWYDANVISLTHEGKPITDAEAKNLGYQVIKEPLDGNPFDDADESEVEYCTQCESYMPEEDRCGHLFCDYDGGGWAYGCGSSEVDIGAAHRSLIQLLKVMPENVVDAMRKSLLRRDLVVEDRSRWSDDRHDLTIRIGRRYVYIDVDQLYRETDGEKRYWPGMAWLMSLDKSTREPMALTLGWIWQYQRESWNGRCVIGNITFIRHLDEAEMQEWQAIDPFAVESIPPMLIKVPFEVTCANDSQFLKHPEGTSEVLLWPKDPGKDDRAIRLSVAKVHQGKLHDGTQAVELTFGRVLGKNGVELPGLPGYELCRG